MTNPFDRPSAVFASVSIAVIGWAVFMGMPILVGALIDTRGFSEEQAGYIASADLGGMFIASIFVSSLINKINRRHWVLAGALITIFANFFSSDIDQFGDMLAIRVVAGFGSGLCYTLALANLSATSDTAKSFSFLIFTFVAVNSVELFTLPRIADAYGVSGIFYAFIAVNIICLCVYPLLPVQEQSDSSVVAEGQEAGEEASQAGEGFPNSPLDAGLRR